MANIPVSTVAVRLDAAGGMPAVTDSHSSYDDGSSPIAEALESPRTRIARMLKEIDDADDVDGEESGERETSPSPVKPRTRDLARTSSPAPPTVGHIASEANRPAAVFVAQSDGGSDDDPEDRVVAPRGRGAARMFGRRDASAAVHDASERSESPAEDEAPVFSPPRQPATSRNIPRVNEDEEGGLFVSPAKSTNNESAQSDDDSDDDLPTNPFGSKEKLALLVAQKRQERLAREASEQQHRQSSDAIDAELDEDDEANDAAHEDVERILSDASRPARKASKKALLEMERETQRIARQQALAHQMKTRKKFTTQDLFAKFNFRQVGAATEASAPIPETGNSSSPNKANDSDGAEEKPREPVSTPPSSPPTPLDRQKAKVNQGALSKMVLVKQQSFVNMGDSDDDDALPDIAQALQATVAQSEEPVAAIQSLVKKGLSTNYHKFSDAQVFDDGSSDNELEIIPSLPRHLRVFEKVTGATNKPVESRAIHNLKHLSHSNYNDAPRKQKGAKPSINPQVLQAQLLRRAKQQARQEQLQHIADLRARGIVVETADQRERAAEDLENLLEKAREDAVLLRRAEKAAANGDADVEVSDDEEDEDYDGSDEELDEDGEGLGVDEEDEDEGEDEDDDGDDESDKEEEEEEGNELIDAAAEVDDDDDDSIEPQEEQSGTEGDVAPLADSADSNLHTPLISRRPRVSRRVIEDDEDAEAQSADERSQNPISVTPHVEPTASAEVDDPFAAFGFGAGADDLMSPTQAFNATMQTPTQMTQEDSMDLLRQIRSPSGSLYPPPTFGPVDAQGFSAEPSRLPASQHVSLALETPQRQPPATPVANSVVRDGFSHVETPLWEPTQDAGLPSPLLTKRGGVARSESIVSSVIPATQVNEARETSVQAEIIEEADRPRGKLRRKIISVDGNIDDNVTAPAGVPSKRVDAFQAMAKKRREALTAAERAEADQEMRGMIEEDAEESEDEYAGLGGDDYIAPETAEDREMIDSSIIDVDERQLAAHFAERERARDEAEASKLFKDLTTGALRRRAGANNFDLYDDEGELAVRRWQMKQREEGRKRRALLRDENIASLADGKQSVGKDAFLRAIADDDDEHELVALSDTEQNAAELAASQEESQQTQQAPLKEVSSNKRRLADGDTTYERLPAKQRRIAASDPEQKRPTSLLEVKESLSFLLDEPHMESNVGPSVLELSSDAEASNSSEDDDDDDDINDNALELEQARSNDGGYAPDADTIAMPPPRLPATQRRTAASVRPEVIDRLSLKRASSSGSSSDGSFSRTAWGSKSGSGARIPSLLRRATSKKSLSGSDSNERGVSTSGGVSAAKAASTATAGAMRNAGAKKSSLAAQARAAEHKAIVEASVKRKEENTRRIAEMRRNASGGLGKGLVGRFE